MYLIFQYDELKDFFNEVARNKYPGYKDWSAEQLAKLFNDERNRTYLLFLKPHLVDLRRITKNFQSKSSDNLEVFNQVSTYFQKVASKILKSDYIEGKNVHEIARITESEINSFHLSLDDVGYGRVFSKQLDQNTFENSTQMRRNCYNFLKKLFMGLQRRLKVTLKTVETFEPFTLPKFKNSPPTLENFVEPFFKTDLVSQADYDSIMEDIQPLVMEYDTTETFWIRMHTFKENGEYKFRKLTNGVIRMLCIPLSNAEVERTFR